MTFDKWYFRDDSLSEEEKKVFRKFNDYLISKDAYEAGHKAGYNQSRQDAKDIAEGRWR